ncbi:MAG: HEAT repeat domain-containing protein [Sandaracinaceae bacterium]
MRACLLSFSVLVLLLAAAPASAQQAPSRDQVRALLTGFETVPDDATWQRMGDAALLHLVALYDDGSQPAYVRLRAVGAAGAFPVPASRTFLMAVAQTPRQSDLLVREAVRALGRGFGRRVEGELTSFLTHDSPLVREVAAQALGRSHIGGDALRARLESERNAEVRAAIQTALR